MKTLAPYDPAAVLCTESIKVGLPLRTKLALVEAARVNGISMSGLMRRAAEDAIAQTSRPRGRRA